MHLQLHTRHNKDKKDDAHTHTHTHTHTFLCGRYECIVTQAQTLYSDRTRIAAWYFEEETLTWNEVTVWEEGTELLHPFNFLLWHTAYGFY